MDIKRVIEEKTIKYRQQNGRSEKTQLQNTENYSEFVANYLHQLKAFANGSQFQELISREAN